MLPNISYITQKLQQTAGNNEPQKVDTPIIKMDNTELRLWRTSIQVLYQYILYSLIKFVFM